jgi:hypothetical protein
MNMKQRRVLAEVNRFLAAQEHVAEPLDRLNERSSVAEILAATEEFERRVKAQKDGVLRLAFLAGNREVVRMINTHRNIDAAFERQKASVREAIVRTSRSSNGSST